MTRDSLLRLGGLAAMAAGVLFVVIQPLHPSETLASVTTSTWALVHYATLAMTVLFVAGIAGVYARQVEETGWLGFAGFALLALGLAITAGFAFVEAFIQPLLAEREPEFVIGLLAIVSGSERTMDMGLLPALWVASSIFFPAGCLVFGVAVMRAGVLSRWAAGVFAFGLPLAVIVVSLLPFDLHRWGAVPIGIGLAWLGFGLWAERGGRSSSQPTGMGLGDPNMSAAG